MKHFEHAYELLKELIKIKSPYFYEQEIADYVYEFMLKTGVKVIKQEVSEKKQFNYECNNIIGYLDAKKDKTILINAHMDTIYITEGWDYDPYDATLIEDKVYGLGSADMKGGLTSLLLLLEESMKRYKLGEDFKYNIIFLASVDEEGPYSLGVKTFLRSELSRNIDGCFVLESSTGISKNTSGFPTIIYGSKGCYLYNIKVIGKSSHAANPDSGINAIKAMCKIVEKIDEISLEHNEMFNEPARNVIWINGGQKALSTPEKCEIIVDFHITPNESKEDLKEKLIQIIDSLNLGVDVEIDYMKDDLGLPMVYQPYLLDKENKILCKLVSSCKSVLDLDVVPTGTSICVGDFNHFNAAGIDTVVIGPDGSNLHCGNEYVILSDIIKLKDILLDYVLNR